VEERKTEKAKAILDDRKIIIITTIIEVVE